MSSKREGDEVSRNYRSRMILRCENLVQAEIMRAVLSVDEALTGKLIISYSTTAKDCTTVEPVDTFGYSGLVV